MIHQVLWVYNNFFIVIKFGTKIGTVKAFNKEHWAFDLLHNFVIVYLYFVLRVTIENKFLDISVPRVEVHKMVHKWFDNWKMK